MTQTARKNVALPIAFLSVFLVALVISLTYKKYSFMTYEAVLTGTFVLAASLLFYLPSFVKKDIKPKTFKSKKLK
jgi:hypothetical protein